MPVERLFMGPDDFRAGDFDARKRYLRAGNTLSNFPLCSGLTVKFERHAAGGQTYSTLRYSVNGYVKETTQYYNYGGASGAIDAGSYNAPFVLVTT